MSIIAVDSVDYLSIIYIHHTTPRVNTTHHPSTPALSLSSSPPTPPPLQVDANLLFALAERDGRHRFTLTLSPVIQTAAGQPGQVPPVGPASYRATDGKVHLDIDLADLLVQETEVSRTLPMSPLAPLPPSFAAVPELLRVTVRVAVRHVEGKGKREGRDAGAAAHGVASQKSGDGGGVTTVGNVPGSPRPLLPVGLAKMFNPMVLRPVLAKDLPDAPATMQQLDELCDKASDDVWGMGDG